MAIVQKQKGRSLRPVEKVDYTSDMYVRQRASSSKPVSPDGTTHQKGKAGKHAATEHPNVNKKLADGLKNSGTTPEQRNGGSNGKGTKPRTTESPPVETSISAQVFEARDDVQSGVATGSTGILNDGVSKRPLRTRRASDLEKSTKRHRSSAPEDAQADAPDSAVAQPPPMRPNPRVFESPHEHGNLFVPGTMTVPPNPSLKLPESSGGAGPQHRDHRVSNASNTATKDKDVLFRENTEALDNILLQPLRKSVLNLQNVTGSPVTGGAPRQVAQMANLLNSDMSKKLETATSRISSLETILQRLQAKHAEEKAAWDQQTHDCAKLTEAMCKKDALVITKLKDEYRTVYGKYKQLRNQSNEGRQEVFDDMWETICTHKTAAEDCVVLWKKEADRQKSIVQQTAGIRDSAEEQASELLLLKQATIQDAKTKLLLADQNRKQSKLITHLRRHQPKTRDVAAQCFVESHEVACGGEGILPWASAVPDLPTHQQAELARITGMACSLCPEGVDLNCIDPILVASDLFSKSLPEEGNTLRHSSPAPPCSAQVANVSTPSVVGLPAIEQNDNTALGQAGDVGSCTDAVGVPVTSRKLLTYTQQFGGMVSPLVRATQLLDIKSEPGLQSAAMLPLDGVPIAPLRLSKSTRDKTKGHVLAQKSLHSSAQPRPIRKVPKERKTPQQSPSKKTGGPRSHSIGHNDTVRHTQHIAQGNATPPVLHEHVIPEQALPSDHPQQAPVGTSPPLHCIFGVRIAGITSEGLLIELPGYDELGLVPLEHISRTLQRHHVESEETKLQYMKTLVDVGDQVWVKVICVSDSSFGIRPRVECSMLMASQKSGQDMDSGRVMFSAYEQVRVQKLANLPSEPATLVDNPTNRALVDPVLTHDKPESAIQSVASTPATVVPEGENDIGRLDDHAEVAAMNEDPEHPLQMPDLNAEDRQGMEGVQEQVLPVGTQQVIQQPSTILQTDAVDVHRTPERRVSTIETAFQDVESIALIHGPSGTVHRHLASGFEFQLRAIVGSTTPFLAESGEEVSGSSGWDEVEFSPAKTERSEQVTALLPVFLQGRLEFRLSDIKQFWKLLERELNKLTAKMTDTSADSLPHT